jgi:hypothetical protein
MNPYLSVCLGIGGVLTNELLDRLRVSTDKNLALAESYGVPMELVICDWGMKLPTPKPSLERIWKDFIHVRIIHVPRSVCYAVPNPNRLPYLEFQPKNVAIRRARGQWILSTNPDDVWSSEFVEFLSWELLHKDNFYRVNRYDVKYGKVFRICYETCCAAPGEPHNVPTPGGVEPGGLHFNAAGDFLLMHRDSWWNMHGHPEQPYSHTVDGQSVYLAHLKGLKQVILPFPLYHPEHDRTLNLNVDGELIAPDWDGNHPHTKENDDSWGQAGMDFEETVL